MTFRIQSARPQDAAILHSLVRGLAEYEKLSHQVVGTEAQLREELFGPHPVIESVICWEGERAVGFALFSTTSRLSSHGEVCTWKTFLFFPTRAATVMARR